MSDYAAAVSEHPLISHAAGEVIGQVLDGVGEAPELAVLFVTTPNIGAIDDIVAAVHATLSPRTLLGVTAVSIIGNDREVEEAPAISLWAARSLPGTAVRLEARQGTDGWTIGGFPPDVTAGDLLLLADPFSFPVDGLLHHFASAASDLRVFGGLASASQTPYGNRLVHDGAVHRDGAVGYLMAPGSVQTVVSQGCRPIGEPFTITAADQNLITGLGGQPATERLDAIIAALDDADRELLQRGLHIGLVVDEQQLDFTRGDFLIRGVLGLERATGAVAVGERVEVGQTVQFQVRDAESADEDLRSLMEGCRAKSGLVFTCNGRGSHLFDEPDHDAGVVSEALGRAPLAGMFCAGEVGPVGSSNHLHGFTASVVLFS